MSHEFTGPAIETYLEPLVGDEAAEQAFRTTLSDVDYANMSLADGLTHIRELTSIELHRTANEIKAREPGCDWRHAAKAGLVGVELALSGLRTLGEEYVSTATAPQLKPQVLDNTRRVLDHVRGVAYREKLYAKLNFWGLYMGMDPKDPLTYVYAKHKSDKIELPPWPYPVSSESLDISLEADQLIVAPRFDLAGEVSDVRCPATDAKTQRGPRKVPSLPLFINIFGDVAVNDVYPHHFQIIDPTNT